MFVGLARRVTIFFFTVTQNSISHAYSTLFAPQSWKPKHAKSFYGLFQHPVENKPRLVQLVQLVQLLQLQNIKKVPPAFKSQNNLIMKNPRQRKKSHKLQYELFTQ